MTFEIDVGGRTRTVSIEPVGGTAASGGRFLVRVDGQPLDVESRVTDLGLSLRYAGDGRSVDVAVTDRGAGEFWIQLPHVGVDASVDARRYRRAAGGPAATAGEIRVVAPMPGRIVRVLVAAGDDVAAGQGLVVVEAMKMENEIRAARAGRVKEVGVVPGVSVESGRHLMTIE